MIDHVLAPIPPEHRTDHDTATCCDQRAAFRLTVWLDDDLVAHGLLCREHAATFRVARDATQPRAQ